MKTNETRNIAELQDLAPHIQPDDVELLEAAGVPEENEITLRNLNYALRDIIGAADNGEPYSAEELASEFAKYTYDPSDPPPCVRVAEAAPAMLAALRVAESSMRPPTRGAMKGYVSPELATVREAIARAEAQEPLGSGESPLLTAARYALADLEGVMPVVEPDGDRLHPGWKTIEDLRTAISNEEGDQ
jgi:hypothetical protein